MIINSKNRQVLQIGLYVLVAIMVLGVGYASISAINLIVNGNATASVNQNNFIVHFIEAKNITGTTGVGGTSVIESDDTKASFNVEGLSNVGDYAEAKYVIKNDSSGIGAEITLELANSNPEYFKVTETIEDNKLQAGDTTLATVKVEMIKTPIDSDVSTSVTAILTANPLENAEALGGNPSSVVKPEEPKSFATDSWATIKKAVQNNNTSAYNIGDTKIVSVNGTDYTVRIANKSTHDWCDDEAYSQTACGFVVEFVDIVSVSYMRNEDTNSGGYPATLVYDYLKNTLYGQLPVDLQNAIKSTRVISGHGCIDANYDWNNNVCNTPENNGNNYVTTDKLFLLSGTELYGTLVNKSDTSSSTTSLLDFYSQYTPYIYCGDYTLEVAKKKYNDNYYNWWLRSPRSDRFNSFEMVIDYGGLNNGTPSRYWGSFEFDPFGISPAFRVG